MTNAHKSTLAGGRDWESVHRDNQAVDGRRVLVGAVAAAKLLDGLHVIPHSLSVGRGGSGCQHSAALTMNAHATGTSSHGICSQVTVLRKCRLG